MRRGTTVDNVFTTDVDLTMASAIYITYKQANTVVVEKELSDMTVTADSITVSLTQEDTLAFHVGNIVEIQIRAKFQSGSAIASNIMKADVEQILKEGVI